MKTAARRWARCRTAHRVRQQHSPSHRDVAQMRATGRRATQATPITFCLIVWIMLPILRVLFWNIQDLHGGYCFCQSAALKRWVYGSIQVAGRIVEIAGNRHSVDGACICGRPQWLFDAGFYFWYKGYISFSLKFRCETWNIIKNYRINGLKCQKNIDMWK